MTRRPQSRSKTLRVSDVLSDHGSSMGGLLKRASLLMQVEHRLAGCLDPEFAGRFQLAAIRTDRAILVTPSASWATRLRLSTPDLVEALHQAGFPDIDRIDVRVAPLAGRPQAVRRRRPLSPAARQALELMGRLDTGDED
ncbi:MAG: DUF721 domain-containing protein [Xanthomonadales bacterium]|nr:DUF721 domain-containing protein [Xanthomonadales bacterium]